jgi:hypothetical protein
MPSDRIMQQWASFAHEVLHPDCPPDQIREMRRAFFAGAVSVLHLLQQIAEDDVDDDESVEGLQEMWIECADFTERVTAGEF